MPLPLALLPWMPAIAAGTGAAIKTGQRYGPQIVQGGINLLNRAGQSPWLTNLANRFTYGFAPHSGKLSNTFSQAALPGGMISSNPMNIYGLDTLKSGIEFPQEVADDKEFWKEQFDKLLSKDKKEEDKIVEIDGEFYTIDKEGKTKKLELKKETKKNEESSKDDDSMPPSNWMDEMYEDEKKSKEKKSRKDAIEALTKINPEFSNLSKERQERQIKSYMDAQNLKKGGYVKKQRKRKHYKAKGFVKMKKSKKRKYIKE